MRQRLPAVWGAALHLPGVKPNGRVASGLLESSDELDSFDCRSAEQTTWLRRHARQAHASNSAKVLVVTVVDSLVVVAYYAWCMASVSPSHLPARHRKGAGAYPQRVALLVHCENIEARDFYLHHAPELEASPTDELHLILLMKDQLRLRR